MGSSHRYCIYCRGSRGPLASRHIQWWHVLVGFVLASLLTYGIWGAWDPRMIPIWVVGLIVAEFCVSLRWRILLACPHCGFDPITYARDPQKMAQIIRQRFDQAMSKRDELLVLPPVFQKRMRELLRQELHLEVARRSKLTLGFGPVKGGVLESQHEDSRHHSHLQRT